jgi:hypothetical protein
MNPRFKTTNLSEKLLQGTQQYIDELKKFPEVVGILITGGLARGFTDKFSDIDIEFFLHKDDFDRWERKSPTELKRKLYNTDVEIEFLNFENYSDTNNDGSNWTMENRWDKSHAKIVYDPNGKIRNLLQAKVTFREDELKNSIKRAHTYAHWFGNMVSESWLERGDILSACSSINIALENFVDFLFLANGEFIPHKKWKFFYVKELGSLPTNFSERFNNVYLAKTDTDENVRSRISIFAELLKEAEVMPKKTRFTSFRAPLRSHSLG